MILGNKMKLYENSTFESIWKNVVSVVNKVVSCGKINTTGIGGLSLLQYNVVFRIHTWVGWVGGWVALSME